MKSAGRAWAWIVENFWFSVMAFWLIVIMMLLFGWLVLPFLLLFAVLFVAVIGLPLLIVGIPFAVLFWGLYEIMKFIF